MIALRNCHNARPGQGTGQGAGGAGDRVPVAKHDQRWRIDMHHLRRCERTTRSRHAQRQCLKIVIALNGKLPEEAGNIIGDHARVLCPHRCCDCIGFQLTAPVIVLADTRNDRATHPHVGIVQKPHHDEPAHRIPHDISRPMPQLIEQAHDIPCQFTLVISRRIVRLSTLSMPAHVERHHLPPRLDKRGVPSRRTPVHPAARGKAMHKDNRRTRAHDIIGEGELRQDLQIWHTCLQRLWPIREPRPENP